MKETFTCEICDEKYDVSEKHFFDNEILCTNCLAEYTVVCQDCGSRIWRDDSAGNIEHPLCQSCYDENYTDCCSCDCLLHRSDANYQYSDEYNDNPYCDSCFDKLPRDGINEYYYKPTPIFYGNSSRFMGVELEIDEAGKSDYNANKIQNIANADREHIYCKHDGSLDSGFEIVTYPMTLQYHQEEMPWKGILRKAVQLNYRSHQSETCGLHIHINRTAFGYLEEEQDEVIARILYFFEKHWEELLKFSRRTQSQLEHWAMRYGYKEQPKDILDHAKGDYNTNRYKCINLCNKETIEFRIFRGTLKLNTLIATLQLVDKICETAINLSDDDLKAMSWTTFTAGCTQPELIQYLKERRLYVNDIVETEDEI